MKRLFILLLLIYGFKTEAQKIDQVFNTAFKKLAEDPTFKHATISLYVINTTTGKPVTEVNTEIGVAPASCQKVITASTAFELFGHDYSYKTTLGYTGNIANGVLNGNLIIKGSGDPTLGSWRYDQTKEEN
ncbi:MAG: D-alanyl-D-alanine carboxypeptidase, partial [Ginsengibacter sp.]